MRVASKTAVVTTIVSVLALGLAAPARAQLDPEERATLELGGEGPLRGNGPISGYPFFLWNQPHLLDKDRYLRVIVAPVYLESELVHDNVPGHHQAIGVGLGGGYMPYSFDEFQLGKYLKSESFEGNGGEAHVSYYPRGKLGGVLPIEGQIRVRARYVLYEDGGDTSPRFRLPHDTPIYYGRGGVRLGGEPPEILPTLAMELSLWHEVAYRQEADEFGLPERPNSLHQLTQRSWGRVGGDVTPMKGHTIRAFLTAGVVGDTDVLSTFRMGSSLVFRTEFPLVLHGYYVDEIFARRFWLVNLAYRFPVIPGSDRLQVRVSGDYAQVDYFPGHRLPRTNLRGVGTDLSMRLTDRLTFLFGYGYGIDAPRDHHFGGHELNVAMEWKFRP